MVKNKKMASGIGERFLLRAQAALLAAIASLSVGISPQAFAYSGLTGKVSSLLCQTRIAAAGSQEDYARTFYAAADPVVQQRCLGCHIENGIAPNAGAKLALKSSDRGYVMETGRVVLQGPAKELANDPQVRSAYLGS